jgi:hypothetical protein
MTPHRTVRVLPALALVLALTEGAEAKSLSRRIQDATTVILTDVPTPNNPNDPTSPVVLHEAHFDTASALRTLSTLKAMSANAADFPAISTAPGFTYRFDPSVGMFERSSASLGPIFVERPQTIGRGKVDVGAYYMYFDFQELSGDDLDSIAFTNLEHNDCCSATAPPPSQGNPAFESDTAAVFVEKFNLTSHVVSFSGTYGITDRWDVNLLLPVVHTSLDMRVRQEIQNASGTHFFDAARQTTTQTVRTDDDTTGVGDLLLRTKYHILSTNLQSPTLGADRPFDLALGTNLRFPTGSEDDFQGAAIWS